MHYRLLRNNKESGPFTALQLKELGLKPYDLLWAEGRGAAWQYASEIPELKLFAPVIEEQPFDRFFKKDEEKATAKQTVVSEKKTKPRFRISGDKIIMVEAGNMEVATNGIIKETTQIRLPKEPVAEKIAATPDWQDMYEQWQPEPQKMAIKKEEPVEVETKYSESLDDLKKRYAEKVLNEKSEKRTTSLSSASVKQNIMAAVALIVLVVGGYIGYTLKQKDAAKTAGTPVVERADVSGDNVLSARQKDDNNTVNNNAQNIQNNSTQKSNTDINAAQIKTVKPSFQKPVETTVVKNANENKTLTADLPKKETNTAVKTNPSVAKTDDKTVALLPKKNNAVKTNDVANNSNPIAQSTTSSTVKNTAGNTVAAPVATPPAVKQNAPKKIDDYVSVKKIGGNSSSVQNVRLLVNNISDFPIDLAVIDVQYFDSKGKYQKGETMFVKNIDGGNNVEIRVPDSDKSSSIKYKVSLVSSEKKTLYLVGD